MRYSDAALDSYRSPDAGAPGLGETTHIYTYADRDSDRNAHGDADCHCNRNVNSDCNCNGYAYRDTNAHANAYCDSYRSSPSQGRHRVVNWVAY